MWMLRLWRWSVRMRRGKTSLLDALVQLNGSAPFDAGDITQGYSPKGRLLDALYRLDEDDRTAVAAIAPDAPKVRWYRVWREAADGTGV